MPVKMKTQLGEGMVGRLRTVIIAAAMLLLLLLCCCWLIVDGRRQAKVRVK